MVLITHKTRCEDGEYKTEVFRNYSCPAEFVLKEIPDGTPFRCYAQQKEISRNIDLMTQESGEYLIIEGSGGLIGIGLAVLGGVFAAASLLQPEIPSINQQGASANNSLTDRKNEPRPYKRIYDICGTVQAIPSDLMQQYSLYDATNKEYNYGYYYVARGYVDTPESGILDGDTLLSTVTGSSANIYDPFKSPNNSTPRQIVGDQINEPLFITQRSNSVDGIELKAPNAFDLELTDVAVQCQLVGTTGSLVESSGTLDFEDFYDIGQEVELKNVRSGLAELDGVYTVLAISSTSISFDVGSKLPFWALIDSGGAPMDSNSDAVITPTNADEIGFTDWVTISTIKPERVVANIVARQGMYKAKSSNDSTKTNSATVELQWQLVEDGSPVGPITTVSKTLTDKSRNEVGMSVVAPLSTQSAVRVRVRRSSELDKKYKGSSIDTLTYRDLYGQIEDDTDNYGDMTTVHTVRRATPQATSIKEPQLKMLVTEMVYKYQGAGVFDSVRTPNTQAVQSLIRLARDPLVGGLTLSNENMDDLLAAQADIETYFDDVRAGQFCYTFDELKTTAQDVFNTIAEAVFSKIYRDRETGNIALYFEKPVSGPAMLFTHRSKIGTEKWTRKFAQDKKDSVEFTYIDPETNIRETIRIPENGGVKPRKIESKGVRNYQQAFWLAHRARQKDILQRVDVDLTTTKEGVYVIAGQPVSVVKGSRVASFDGYIVAQDGLTLTLSQEVEFTDGDDHFIQLKKRDGSVESVQVTEGANKRTVNMLSAPAESIYTGNSATKTEFSFGNEARHLAQLIIPVTVDPQTDKSVKITGVNYHEDLYLYDSAPPQGRAYDSGFSNGYA